jgi:hypothetical protein
LVRRVAAAHGFYFATAGAALLAASLAFTGLARLTPIAAVWWIAALHELGHAFVALAFGMRVPRCWATPWFGRTTITHGNRAAAFGVVALAGPLAGVAAAMLVHTFATSAAFGSPLGVAGQSWLAMLAWLGGVESALNLLPVHRLLDGHAVWRSFRRGRRERAERRRVQVATPRLRPAYVVTIPRAAGHSEAGSPRIPLAA